MSRNMIGFSGYGVDAPTKDVDYSLSQTPRVEKLQVTDSLTTNGEIPTIESALLNSDELYRIDALFLGFIDRMGRLKNYVARHKSFENYAIAAREKTTALFMQAALEHSLHEELDDEFGDEEFTVTRRKNYKIVTIPLSNGLLYAIMKKQSSHGKLVFLVRKLLRANRRFQRK